MAIFSDIEIFVTALPNYGRLGGMDHGSKTIGLALSDGMRSIATADFTVARTKFSKNLAEIQAWIEEHSISGLVVGYPRNLDGSEGSRCQSVRQFCANLEQGGVSIPILLWDERLSTTAVERTMLEADLSRARRKELVDKLAASFILQGALDRLRFVSR